MSAPLPPLTSIPPDVAAVSDYEPLAQARMSAATWAYFAGGAGDEWTLRENVAAFARHRLCPRALRDLRGGSTRTRLLGLDLAAPILLAPIAFHRLLHPEGELATVLAAGAMETAMVVSTQASVRLEDIAARAQAPLWFQLYIQPDRAFTADLVRRAEQAGYRALVVTVDAPVNGVRNREQRAGFALPPGIGPVNLQGMRLPPAGPPGALLFGSPLLEMAPRWDDLAWLRGLTRLPIILKGITHPDDARQAVAAGMDGLIVSNHGGRTLDGVPASIDLLPPIAAAVGGQIPILMDGGIRRGTDVLRALALGAQAVLIGRPYIFALAAAGAPGVAHVIRILRAELELAMALTGCRDVNAIDGSVLVA
ncbi:alpha-hydroxy acid oxidase [Niveispirillum sp. BGYR6]|uniref:alpha-hydroxy acid oxidase n=1 Tax=Niveispirillum sp. BGYR6 TaxID=2971249 RepID=UPI0022B96518|nr:alpha-hydroxy acid oxidase [Niveispirillum sp. BGYR6]MDG5496097.1 alpha-hydroxy acid oxidase [Niveispirillum sp. BGYR6]